MDGSVVNQGKVQLMQIANIKQEIIEFVFKILHFLLSYQSFANCEYFPIFFLSSFFGVEGLEIEPLVLNLHVSRGVKEVVIS